MDLTEIEVKSALCKSRIHGVEYVINPYIGCAHGCQYCYARFMSKWSKHHAGEPWGSFVEVKVNLPELLARELRSKKKPASVLLSSVCDPYQPAEARYQLTRQCLLHLVEFGWGIEVLTRSPLVARDMDIFQKSPDAVVGFSIPTDDDDVRKVLEPHAPSIPARLEALKGLHSQGIKTWVFIAPVLPMHPATLAAAIHPYVDHVLIDRLNYRQSVAQLFRMKRWDLALSDDYARQTAAHLIHLLEGKAKTI